MLLTPCCTAFPSSFFLQGLLSPLASPQQCSVCQMLLLQGCTSLLGNCSHQRQGRSSLQRRVRLRLRYFVVLILIWSKTSTYTSDLIIICNYLQGHLLTFRHVGRIWPYSMPRLCANTFVRGEVFACEQHTMLIHSKTDPFAPLQLLVPLW